MLKFNFFINLAGTPPQSSFGGISLVTIDPAATTEFRPMVTGAHITVLHPKKQFSSSLTSPTVKLVLILEVSR